MKQATIQITFEEEKLRALRRYIAKRDSTLEAELQKAAQRLYEKVVPAAVQEYISDCDLGILPPEELERRCRLLGAEILPSNADFCARFDFAPRYPVWLKVWFADEEFPASGRLLLDESAPHYLTIEDAVTVGSLILDQLTGAQHWAV